MSTKEKILLAGAVLVLFSFLLMTIFGDNGLLDLNERQQDRDILVQKNKALAQKNLIMSREIDRLKNDPEYIERIARKELGMVRKDEVIIQIRDRNKKGATP